MQTQEERFMLTRQGYERLKAELAEWESTQAERRSQMEDIYHDVDRSNNDEEAADFDVRTRKEFADERVGHLRYVLEHAEVMDEDPDPKRINAGDRVTVWDLEAREEHTYNLVDGEESVGVEDIVTVDSPVGQALLGRSIGDVVEVDVPDGWMRLAVRRLDRVGD